MKKFCIILLAGMMACHSTKKVTKTEATPAVVKAPTELQLAQAKVPGITMERLTEGSKLYAQNCAKCHNLKDPANYTMERWVPILRSMFPKAKITDETQQNLIRDYVMAKSKS